MGTGSGPHSPNVSKLRPAAVRILHKLPVVPCKEAAMNHFLNGVARAVAETFDLPEPILEVGSYKVEGQEEIAELRPLFEGKSYLGVDARPGPGVDQVADVEDLPFADRTFGTVIVLNTFEHVRHFWRGFEEAYRVLRPDGALV